MHGFSKKNLRYGSGVTTAKDSFDRVTADDIDKKVKQSSHARVQSMALQGIAQVDLMINKGKSDERRGADLVDLSQDSQINFNSRNNETQINAARMRNNQSSKVSFLKKIK